MLTRKPAPASARTSATDVVLMRTCTPPSLFYLSGDGARNRTNRRKSIEQRIAAGDFKGDHRAGASQARAAATLVDRRSRYTIVVKIQSKNADTCMRTPAAAEGVG